MRKIVLAAALVAMPVVGWAHITDEPHHRTYWTDSSGKFVRDGSGNCVRAVQWGSDSKVEGCDEMPAPEPAPAPVPVVKDSDGDGVPDTRDRCPGTPAGVAVDVTDCPLDSDGDGVPDYKDRCPGTRPGAKVDAQGCEVKEKVLKEASLEVRFALNSAKIQDSFVPGIKDVADFMQQYPDTSVTVEGHTDSTGDAGYNQMLSEKRAKAVADRLVNKYGIAASRVQAVGHGESRPVASNATREGRAQNRRVVAVIKAMVEQ